MELLVSVVLIALITLFMYGAIASSKMTAKTIGKHSEIEQNRTLVYELFYRDIAESLWIRPEQTPNRRFTVVSMQTRNSLYDIAAPNVVYYVNTNTNSLIRLESASTISLPVSYEEKYFIHADELVKNVHDFNVYISGMSTNTSQKSDTGAPAEDPESLSSQEDADKAEANASVEVSGASEARYLLYLNSDDIPYMLLDLAI